MKKFILFFTAVVFAVAADAQTIQWAKKYPKLAERTSPQFLETSPISGLAVAGDYETHDVSMGTFLYKLDGSGNSVWGDTIQGVNPSSYSIAPTGMDFNSTGKLFMSVYYTDTISIDGTTYYPGASKNSMLIRYDLAGGKDWIKTYPNVVINDLYVDNSDNLNVMFNFSGTVVFYGQTYTSLGVSDLVVAKISPADNLIFSKQLHGTTEGVKFKTAPSGNMYVMASFRDTLYYDTYAHEWSSANYDHFVLKMDAAGNQLYYNLICANPQERTTDFEFNYQERLMVSTTHCWTSGCYANLRTYDAAGNQTSMTSINGTTCYYGCGFDMKSLAVADTGGVWGIGTEGNTLDYAIPTDDWTNLGLRKFDFYGNVLMYDTIKTSWVGDFWHKDIAADNSQNIYISAMLKDVMDFGSITLTNTGPDPEFVVAKFSQLSVSTDVLLANAKRFEVYPNPASGVVNIRYNCDKNSCIQLQIKNILGEIVFADEKKDASQNYIRQIDMSNQAKGIYFLELNNGSEREVRKVILN